MKVKIEVSVITDRGSLNIFKLLSRNESPSKMSDS